jgi:fructose-1,6-bisphosphatase/inositol monophosphatase family enzyme
MSQGRRKYAGDDRGELDGERGTQVLRLRGATTAAHVFSKLTQLQAMVKTPGLILARSFEQIKHSQYLYSQAPFAERAYRRSMDAIYDELERVFMDTDIISPDSETDTLTGQKREIYADGLVGWNNFARGRYGWGILIGMYFDGICEACVLHNPLTAETYSAGLTQGFFLNQRRIRPTNRNAVQRNHKHYNLDCRALDIATVASGSIDSTEILIDCKPSWHPALLFVDEAMGSISERQDKIVLHAGSLKKQH